MAFNTLAGFVDAAVMPAWLSDDRALLEFSAGVVRAAHSPTHMRPAVASPASRAPGETRTADMSLCMLAAA